MSVNMSFADQLSFNTVRIACNKRSGEESVGTGFFFGYKINDKDIPVIITNYHVIEGASEGSFQLTRTNKDGSPNIGVYENIILDNCESHWIKHPNKDVDLCAMPIAPLFHIAKSQGISFFYRKFSKDLVATSEQMAELSTLEEIIMIGYPVGVWDSINNMPIFRKGIIATRPDLDYENRKEFLIDAACFPGSSGSPVMLYNLGGYTKKNGTAVVGESRIKLLGILYGGHQYTVEGKIQQVPIPTKTIPISTSQIPTNLGVVIKAELILEFETVLLKMLKEQAGS
jgi:hypothetical protein